MNEKRYRNGRKGSAIVEFSLILLPLFFMLVGVLELGRAMWTFHSVSSAVKTAARYAVVRGADCSAASSSCAPRVADIAGAIREASLGLEPEKISVTLQAGPHIVSCAALEECLVDTAYWPAWPNNSVGQMIKIRGEYSFSSVLNSFWPGATKLNFTFQSESSEVIQF